MTLDKNKTRGPGQNCILWAQNSRFQAIFKSKIPETQ